jgi:hypothetical protein
VFVKNNKATMNMLRMVQVVLRCPPSRAHGIPCDMVHIPVRRGERT